MVSGGAIRAGIDRQADPILGVAGRSGPDVDAAFKEAVLSEKTTENKKLVECLARRTDVKGEPTGGRPDTEFGARPTSQR